MRKLRLISFVSFALVALPALASFDLMYLPLQDGRIQRYDPVNRIGLGTMTMPSTASSLWYRGGTLGQVQLAAGAYFANLVTGALGSYNGVSPIVSISDDGQTLNHVSFSGLLERPMGSQASTLRILTGWTNTGNSFFTQDNDVFSISLPSTTRITAMRHNRTTGALLDTIDLTTSAVSPGLRSSMIHSVARGGQHVFSSVYANNGNLNLFRIIFTGSGITTSTTTLSGFNLAGNISLAPAHNGYYVVGQDSTNTALTRFQMFDDDGFGVALNAWTESFTINSASRGVGIVLAPEPSSMIMFALGGLALLRRRK